MNHSDIPKKYFHYIEMYPDLPPCLLVVKVLLDIIEKSRATTVREIDYEVKNAEKLITQAITKYPIIGVPTCRKLFQHYITLTELDIQKDFKDCKNEMLRRGNEFFSNSVKSTDLIAEKASRFIPNRSTILINGNSTAVLRTLEEALKQKKAFKVVSTLTAPTNKGQLMHKRLQDKKISVKLIPDCVVGIVIKNVDVILIGAEAVMESGGILNDVGTYVIGMCAAEWKKPLYVLSETYKFTKYYPISPTDLPKEVERANKMLEYPYLDYTPPNLITSIISELGITSPSEILWEFQNLYI